MALNFKIREINDEYEESAFVIREAFSTVAREFGITRQNAPTNPAFIEADALVKMKEKGLRMYGGCGCSYRCVFSTIGRDGLQGSSF